MFDRYRRPLGLDYKLAQRVAICQYTSPYVSIELIRRYLLDLEDVLDSS